MMTSGEQPLARFTEAQTGVMDTALAEIRKGKKRSHWMWFVFPQVQGLGFSATAQLYAINSLDEARAYLAHPELGPRLVECARAVLGVDGKSVSEIFGYPDYLKLQSCMTLFNEVAEGETVFSEVLDKYYGGEHDQNTMKILAGMDSAGPSR